ncbi:MAG: hypothetical protein IKR39_13235 [Lachnospiraceae bacterium]|nr:hypothetical protein [Lachnospiraceae bacterium]
MFKNTISGRLLKVFAAAAIIVLFVIFAKENAHAASFNHVHTDACYQEVTKETKHKIEIEFNYPTYHCKTCQKMQPFVEIVYLEKCEAGICARRDVAYRQYCSVCTTYIRNETGVERTHTYTARDIACGMDENTPVAEVSFGAASSEPTNGNVTLNLSVSGGAGDFALADAPYDFGAGFTSNPSFEVSENGTYNATVKDSRGRTVTVSFTVDCIDRDLPVIDSVEKSTEEWTQDGVTLTVTAHDDKSGLNGEAYSFNGGAFTSLNSAKITSNGNISVKVRDAAGNITETFVRVANIGRDPKIVEAEKREAERVAAEKAAAEKDEAERLASEKAAKDKAAKEKATKASNTDKNSGKSTLDKASKTTVTAQTVKTAEKTAKSAVRKSVKAIVSSVKRQEEAGKLISVKNVSKASLKELEAEEVIESVKELKDDAGKSSDAAVSGKADSQNKTAGNLSEGSILQASVGGAAVTVGVILLLLGTIAFSGFSYVYILQGGKKRVICRCRVVSAGGKLTVMVPDGKLKGHGKYLLYISPWKKGFKKKVSVSVMLEGEDNLIPTDEGIAFKY